MLYYVYKYADISLLLARGRCVFCRVLLPSTPLYQGCPSLSPPSTRHVYYFIVKEASLQLILLALGDLVLDGVVAGVPDLGLEVEVDELVLLGPPVAVGVAVVDHLAGAGVADLDGGVGEGAVGGPGELVAAVRGDGEGLGAADVAVGVEALFDGVIEDLALGDGVAGCKGELLASKLRRERERAGGMGGGDSKRRRKQAYRRHW